MPTPITSTTAKMVKDGSPQFGPQYLNPNGGTPQFEFLQGANGAGYATLLDASGNVIFSTSNRGQVQTASESTTGAVAPTIAALMGYKDGSGNIQPFGAASAAQPLMQVLTATYTVPASPTAANVVLPLTPTLDIAGEIFNATQAIIIVNNNSGQYCLFQDLNFTDTYTGQLTQYPITPTYGVGNGSSGRVATVLTNGGGDTVSFTFNFNGNVPTAGGTVAVTVYLLANPSFMPMGVNYNNGTSVVGGNSIPGFQSPWTANMVGLVTLANLSASSKIGNQTPVSELNNTGVLATPYSGVQTLTASTSGNNIIKGANGVLGTLVNTGTATSPTVIVYDNATTNSGTILWQGTLTAGQVVPLGIPAANGITVNLSAAGSVLVSYA